MKLAMIGLGTMGEGMAERLIRGGHTVVGYDPNADAAAVAAKNGTEIAESLANLVDRLPPPRVIWLMVPAGEAVDQTLEALVPLLATGDVVVDGGNSNYKDTLRRAKMLAGESTHLLDVGTSGGVWGREQGYSLMIGGEAPVADRLAPVFETLAPAADRGWGRVGPVGAGHFVKMIHNGIEYGVMQAYAEGFALLRAKHEFDLDLHQVADIWRFGSVIRSWLLDLTAHALAEDPDLDGIAAYVEDSGEGRWTAKEAIDLDVPASVITFALQARLRSRLDNNFADRLLAAMRHEFGGHAVKRE